MSKIFALNEGSYSVDQSKKFIPFDSEVHDPKDRPASLFVHVQPFLLEMGDDLIVMDTGLGYKDEQGELIIHNNIKALGYEPEDVNKVLMSHLHFDHAGGMMKEEGDIWKPSFPDADYFIQKDELEFALTKDGSSYHKESLEQLRRFSGLQLIEGSGNINSEISFELTGAHCPYHQVFKIEAEDAVYFFGGDVVPEAIQVVRRFSAKYDFDGRKAMELRDHYGKLAIENDWTCLMYHDKVNPIVKFEYHEGAFKIK